MGQKIHPYGLRLGIVTDWKSRWYSEKDYASQVLEDQKIRKYLRDELTRGAVSRIDIERIGDKKVQVDIHTGRPGVVIGRGGSEAERLRSGLEDLTGRNVKFNVIEVANPELDAMLLARSVADQLEGRVAFRRAMKRTVTTAMKAGAEGVRVQAQGRLGGADMGRREWYLEGRVPLHTLRADIDFGRATARTTVGAIGIKVWVYRGDLLTSAVARNEKIAAEARLAAGGPAQRRRRSARSRAEAAAGESGGKRLIEAGGGKRPATTTADAAAEFEAAKAEVDELIETEAAVEIAETVAAVEAVEAVAEAEIIEAIVEAEVAEEIAEEKIAEAIVEVEVAEEIAEEKIADAVTEEAVVEAVAELEVAEAVAEVEIAEAIVEAEVAEVIAEEKIAEVVGEVEAVEAIAAEEVAEILVETELLEEAVDAVQVEETPTVETTETAETQKVDDKDAGAADGDNSSDTSEGEDA